MPKPDDLLVYAHIGDLHLTGEHEDNYRDFQAIVSEIADLDGAIDFVYVPGDNADNGLPAQYELVARELSRLPMPVHIITGDHDMEPGALDNFYAGLAAERLPKVVTAGGVRCLFLDICGPGNGGPDFRLGTLQGQWLAKQLHEAAAQKDRCAIFMHTYPDDLEGHGETSIVNAAFAAREILLVDMGHTHYNELANDGRTIFAATRSTGQIEEGPPGYSIVTIDGRVVSWRFRELAMASPIVLVTAPADRRLATDAADPDHVPRGVCNVRASVLGPHAVVHCTCRVDDGEAIPMGSIGDNRFSIDVVLTESAARILVEAEDDHGVRGGESIEIARPTHLDVERHADGSDKDAIEAWPERGIPGGQLGPNRNGRKW